MSQRGDLRALAIWFLVVFAYAITAMVFVREIAIPNIYPISIGGHLPGDSQDYNTLALKKAAEIKAMGLVAFELRPNGQGPAGLTSLLYLLVKSPYIVVFVNGLLHAFSAVVMVLIIRCWFPLRISIIATIPLAISPYMILWFSQLNKDSYSVLGVLLFVYGLIRLVLQDKTLQSVANNVAIVVSGVFLIWSMRPYINLMLVPITTVILLIALVWHFRNKSTFADCFRFVAGVATVLLCLILLSRGAASDSTLDSFLVYEVPSVAKSEVPSVAKECLAKIDSKHWLDEPLLPNYINNKLQAMMGQRCLIFTMLETHSNQTTLHSIVDSNVLPGGSREALRYLPRAGLLGVFSPWPDRWLYSLNQQPSIFYTITSIEAVIMYLGIIGIIIFLIHGKAWLLTIPISLAFMMMIIYGMANPFIGVLYRYRYPWWMIILCLGLAALIALAEDWRRKRCATN